MGNRDWTAIKNEYVTGRESLEKLAKKHEIPIRTIKDRSAKEKWVEERKNFRADVGKKASQKAAKKEAKRLERLRDAAEDVAELIRQDVERIKKLRKDQERITPEDVKMIKDLTAALKNIADVMRDVYEIPTIREKLMQMKYEDYKKMLAEMEKGGEESLLMLAEVMEREGEDGLEKMDGDDRGTEKAEESDLVSTAETD